MPEKHLIIGGGFYGCALALFLRSAGHHVTILDAENGIMQQASHTNQARIHTGFHYPRSTLTAIASLSLHQRFAQDFPEATYKDFSMIYAIAKRNSKISADRFYAMFKQMKAPIEEANSDKNLFDSNYIENCFLVKEYAFDTIALKSSIQDKLAKANITVLLNTYVQKIDTTQTPKIYTSNGVMEADYLYLVGYAGLNPLLHHSDMPLLPLKHERTEVALITPPKALEGKGITVMDGPFFSTMPFPSRSLYSLTHVRHTPRLTWTQEPAPKQLPEIGHENSRYAWMIRDSARYLPALKNAEYAESLYTTKVVLLRNERDDGRPIMSHPITPQCYAILGGKIDNIYDLFDVLKESHPSCKTCTQDLLIKKEYIHA